MTRIEGRRDEWCQERGKACRRFLRRNIGRRGDAKYSRCEVWLSTRVWLHHLNLISMSNLYVCISNFSKSNSHFYWLICLWHPCTYFSLAVKATDKSILSLVNYSQDGAWQKFDWEKFMNCSFTKPSLTRMDDWQVKLKETAERQSGILKPVPIPFRAASRHHRRLTPYSPTPPPRLSFSCLSICLWICHHGNLTPGAEEEGVAWFRQISIAGLIYDGLFRDYNTDERSMHVHLHTCSDINAYLYPWAHSWAVCSILLGIWCKTAVLIFGEEKGITMNIFIWVFGITHLCLMKYKLNHKK